MLQLVHFSGAELQPENEFPETAEDARCGTTDSRERCSLFEEVDGSTKYVAFEKIKKAA
jgi:hypothetical protein